MQGKLPQAAQTYQAVIGAADPWPPFMAEALLGLGSLLLQWNELDAVEAHLERASRWARDLRDDALQAQAALLLARLLQVRGGRAGRIGDPSLRFGRLPGPTERPPGAADAGSGLPGALVALARE